MMAALCGGAPPAGAAARLPGGPSEWRGARVRRRPSWVCALAWEWSLDGFGAPVGNRRIKSFGARGRLDSAAVDDGGSPAGWARSSRIEVGGDASGGARRLRRRARDGRRCRRGGIRVDPSAVARGRSRSAAGARPPRASERTRPPLSPSTLRSTPREGVAGGGATDRAGREPRGRDRSRRRDHARATIVTRASRDRPRATVRGRASARARGAPSDGTPDASPEPYSRIDDHVATDVAGKRTATAGAWLLDAGRT